MAIDVKNLSAEERADLKKQLEAFEAIDECVEQVAAAVALKWALDTLGNAGKLGEAFTNIPPQAQPREKTLAKPADLSETQITAIREKVLSGLNAVSL